MSIPISHVVEASISLSPTAVPLEGFGQLAMVTDETPEVAGSFTLDERIRTYGSLTEVTVDFLANTEAYAAAAAFFGQKASKFSVVLASSSVRAGKLTGGTPSSLADIKLITAGTLDITVDGTLDAMVGLDFSAAVDEPGVATILTTALAGATCAFVSPSYVITSDTTGVASTVSFPATGVTATALGLTVGSVQSLGLAIETPTEALVAAAKLSDALYGVVVNKKWRDSSASIDVATWTQATEKQFFNTSNNPNCLTTSTDHIIAELRALSLDSTLSSYSSKPAEYPSAAVAGRAFIVNFGGTDTTITLNLKVGNGVSVEDMTLNQKLNLESHYGNAFVTVAGANVYSDSRLSSGKWFDTIHGTAWLKDNVQKAIFNVMFQTNTKIPYTDSGVSSLIQALDNALQQSVTNGLVAAGNDLDGNFMPLGYEITAVPVSESSDADRSNRIYRGLSFKAAGSGAIHGAVISGDFNG